MGNDIFKKSLRPHILFLAFFIFSAQGQKKDSGVDCSDWTLNTSSLYPITVPLHDTSNTISEKTPSSFLNELYAIASEKNSKNFFSLIKSSQWEWVGFETDDKCRLYNRLHLRKTKDQETISFCETGKKSKINYWTKKDTLIPMTIFGGITMVPKNIWVPETCREGYNKDRLTVSGQNKKPRSVVDIAIDNNDESCSCECNPYHSCAILDKSSITKDARLLKIKNIFPDQDLLLCSYAAMMETGMAIFVRTFSPELKTKPFSCAPRA